VTRHVYGRQDARIGGDRDCEVWSYQLQELESMVKLNVWALADEMSAVKLRDCKNVQEYALNIQAYVNDLNIFAESSISMRPKSEHSYYLMQGIAKDHD